MASYFLGHQFMRRVKGNRVIHTERGINYGDIAERPRGTAEVWVPALWPALAGQRPGPHTFDVFSLWLRRHVRARVRAVVDDRSVGSDAAGAAGHLQADPRVVDHLTRVELRKQARLVELIRPERNVDGC